MVKKGDTPTDARYELNRSYDFVKKRYKGSSVAKKAQISSSTTPTPPITSPTGTGNIQVLDMRTGGQQSPIISGGDGPAEASQIPAFSSSDPSNLSTITVRSIYGLVN